MEKPISVNILGNDYIIQSDEDSDKVYKLADYVNKKVKEIDDNVNGLSERRKLILVALNIANDYFQILKEKDELINDIRQRSNALINNIDSTIR